MKNINIDILAKRKELIKLFKNRKVLIKLAIEFNKEPETTILKLTSLDILSSENQDKFAMYNKGLVGINTKDSAITLAQNELYSVIKNLGKSMLTIVNELPELNPVLSVIDNVKILNEYLSDVGASNLFNVINNDKAMAEYATNKIHNIVSILTNPGADNDACIDVMYSISDTILNNLRNIDTSVVVNYNSTIIPKAASIKIDSKQIEDTLNSVLRVSEIDSDYNKEISYDPSIVSDKLNDYLILSKHELTNTTLIKSLTVLYNDLKQGEIKLPKLIEELSLVNYSNLITTIKNTNNVIERYSKNELTDKEFIKLYSEYESLLIGELNNNNVVINSAIENSNKLNKLTYILYLTKALIEKILIEATIK